MWVYIVISIHLLEKPNRLQLKEAILIYNVKRAWHQGYNKSLSSLNKPKYLFELKALIQVEGKIKD